MKTSPARSLARLPSRSTRRPLLAQYRNVAVTSAIAVVVAFFLSLKCAERASGAGKRSKSSCRPPPGHRVRVPLARSCCNVVDDAATAVRVAD